LKAQKAPCFAATDDPLQQGDHLDILNEVSLSHPALYLLSLSTQEINSWTQEDSSIQPQACGKGLPKLPSRHSKLTSALAHSTPRWVPAGGKEGTGGKKG